MFKEIVEFIDKLTNNKKGFSREKAKNSVKSTSFENLKKIEKPTNKYYLATKEIVLFSY